MLQRNFWHNPTGLTQKWLHDSWAPPWLLTPPLSAVGQSLLKWVMGEEMVVGEEQWAFYFLSPLQPGEGRTPPLTLPLKENCWSSNREQSPVREHLRDPDMSALGLGDVREHTLFPTLVVSSDGKRVLLASHFWPPVVLEGEHSPAPLFLWPRATHRIACSSLF